MLTLQDKKNRIITTLKQNENNEEMIDMLHNAMFENGSLQNGNAATSATSKYKITAKRDTILKIKPIDSTQLSNEQKKECKAGTDLELDELEIVANSHLKLKLKGKSTFEFAFKPHWDIPSDVKVEIKSKDHTDIAGVFKTSVTSLKLSQPDAVTCQSACAAMAVNLKDIYAVRAFLESRGVPGDPAVMSWYLNRELGNNHIFDDNASMSEMREWLRNGEFLITYGWFTNSGHVIALDGVSIEKGALAYKFDVSDPWSEFSFPSWSYNNPQIQFYDGYYSPLGIYAACVASQSVEHARSIYNKGAYDSNHKGAWVHRIIAPKK